ncbi:hypothetical protein CP532_4404 [Ophiocordyceps camponoti-leonardi (nom. inval.)]|nr:hypothetical protein CP532_4404 [Ophiocordyceps camponoti-leonardi (nom. inval.)]
MDKDEEITSPNFDICMSRVKDVLPAICPNFLAEQVRRHELDANAVLNALVELENQGKPYPRRPKTKDLKRKHDGGDGDGDDDVEAAVRRCHQAHTAAGRKSRRLSGMDAHRIRSLLELDYPEVDGQIINDSIEAAGNLLLPAYKKLYEDGHKPVPTTKNSPESRKLNDTIRNCQDCDQRALLVELQTARLAVMVMERRRQTEAEMAAALAEGLVKECQCCFSEIAINCLVECNAEKPHSFCVDCCRHQAETLVGLSKYEIKCMSTDGCEKPFSHSERQKFLNPRLAAALDRLEQEESLRLANIDGMVSCPFCPFAAECGPVEENKEFRCQNPDCEIVSCRLCQGESHLPLSCEEQAKKRGFSARRTIEEAMSAAVIRRCNKCSTPFIKESGCNKMTCTLSSCRNVQCYVCSKSCDYSHFDEPARGGKAGNCPLFDQVDSRHARDMWDAEQNTRKKVVEDNPDMDPSLLDFHMSDKVFDRERQLAKSARINDQDKQNLQLVRARYAHQADAPPAGDAGQDVDRPHPHPCAVAPPGLFPLPQQYGPVANGPLQPIPRPVAVAPGPAPYRGPPPFVPGPGRSFASVAQLTRDAMDAHHAHYAQQRHEAVKRRAAIANNAVPVLSGMVIGGPQVTFYPQRPVPNLLARRGAAGDAVPPGMSQANAQQANTQQANTQQAAFTPQQPNPNNVQAGPRAAGDAMPPGPMANMPQAPFMPRAPFLPQWPPFSPGAPFNHESMNPGPFGRQLDPFMAPELPGRGYFGPSLQFAGGNAGWMGPGNVHHNVSGQSRARELGNLGERNKNITRAQ